MKKYSSLFLLVRSFFTCSDSHSFTRFRVRVRYHPVTFLQTLFHCSFSSWPLISNERINYSVFSSLQSPYFELGNCCVPSVLSLCYYILKAWSYVVEYHSEHRQTSISRNIGVLLRLSVIEKDRIKFKHHITLYPSTSRPRGNHY